MIHVGNIYIAILNLIHKYLSVRLAFPKHTASNPSSEYIGKGLKGGRYASLIANASIARKTRFVEMAMEGALWFLVN